MIYLLLFAGLFMGWSLGTNDAANAFGTAVATRVVSYRTAVIIIAVLVVIGAYTGGANNIDKVSELSTSNKVVASIDEVEEAIAEGVKLNTLTNPIEILGDENRVVSGLRCVKMYQTEVGSDGRKGVKPILNSEFDRSFDFVIYAIGNDCESYLSGLDEIEVTKWNSIIVNKGGQTTKNPYIFAAGDVVTGPATVVQAMSDGKKTAHKIDEFLKNI